MDRKIARRDFLQGAAIGAGGWVAGVLPAELLAAIAMEKAAQDEAGYYPPTRLGMRGSHPGAFEAAHALRDSTLSRAGHGSGAAFDAAEDTGETFDLIVVGAGISGLAAAHFFREQSRGARILILDNHDDFGGHAKRNEFHVNGRMHLLNGGTMLIESPTPYGPVAAGLMNTLGVDPVALDKACSDHEFYESLGLHSGTFFDKETFGVDRLAVRKGEDAKSLEAFLAQTPLSAKARKDILRIEHGTDNVMPGLTSDQKKDRLSRMSYRDYLLNLMKADSSVATYYSHVTDGWWGCGIDAVSALDCWGTDYPGFQGLKLAPGATARMGYTPAGYANTGGSPTFHFPDGNASVARLLVRNLIPDAVPGKSATDVVTAKADYSKLDRAGSRVRIRLNSTVVRVANVSGTRGARASAESRGSPASTPGAQSSVPRVASQSATPSGVEVVYSRGGKLYRARGSQCVLACWNMMIPYLCPDLPAPQKTALHQLIKTPLVYVSVALRNWKAFQKLGLHDVYAPGSYFSSFELNDAVNIGAYKSPRSPDEPILIRMLRTPAKPGLGEREQHKVGRAELLATSFETFERNIREQLARTLSAGGFDPARDIEGIAVNRWPHGYSPEYNCLVDGDLPPNRRPNILGRAKFGRIAIANADAGMGAYMDVAINEAHRAVSELMKG